MNSGHSKGFSLTELAIVTVIVGLLAAGVMAGKHLIESSKIQKVIRELKVYKDAVNSFYKMYGALPGDLPNAYDYWGDNCVTHAGNAAECNGDGNNRLQSPANNQYNLEEFRAWQHLALAGMISGTYTGVNSGNHSPKSEYREEVFYELITPFPPGESGPGCMPDCDSVYTNVPSGIRLNKVYLNLNPWTPMSIQETATIDRKMDDGWPQRGKVVVRRDTCVTGNGVNAEYDLENTDPERCGPVLDLGFSAM